MLNEEGLCFFNAISERLGSVIRNLTTCFAGLVVGEYIFCDDAILYWIYILNFVAAFYRGWEMAFVLSATIPLLIGVGGLISILHTRIKVSHGCLDSFPQFEHGIWLFYIVHLNFKHLR